jgi:hypothetical protein
MGAKDEGRRTAATYPFPPGHASHEHPKSAPIIPIVDNVVAWLGTLGVLSALRRRAEEGGAIESPFL